MKSYQLFFLCIAFHSFLSLCAQPLEYELTGTLKTQGNELVPLKLQLQVQEDGVVSGTSVTHFLSADRTESLISGFSDFEMQVLSFTEIQNISTNSSAAPDEFCYIRVRDLPWKKSVTKTIFNGSFTGYYPDSSQCAEGEIYLVSMELLKGFVNDSDMLSGLKDSLQHGLGDTVVTVEPETSSAETYSEASLVNESERTFNWQSDEIQIQIWDQYEEDNDRFSIYVNGTLRHRFEVATAYKRLYRFNFTDRDTCTIKIVAENEGRRPPNTFQAQLVDGDESSSVETKLKKGEFVTFTFIKA